VTTEERDGTTVGVAGRPVGAARAAALQTGRACGRDGARPSPLRGGGVVAVPGGDRPGRSAGALRRQHGDPPALQPLDAARRVAASLSGGLRRRGQRGRDDRRDRRPRPPAPRRGAQRGGADDEAIGRRRGGLRPTIHATVDAPGHPTACHLTGGQASELAGADAPLPGLAVPTVNADTGYDADLLVVLWRLRCKRSLRDLAELFPERGLVSTHEAVREWEERFAPPLAERLRAKRHGVAGTGWHVDETSVEVHGRWRYLYRAIDRAGDLVDARRSPTRDIAAARRCFARALGAVGHAPEHVTTDGHDADPRASRETLGPGATPRCSRDKNTPIAQDRRGIKQRHSPMRGRGEAAEAARFCTAFGKQRRYSRIPNRSGEPVSLAEHRRRFQDRWAAAMAELAAA